ncbi:MAG TPA: hypothetical protein VGE26_07620 [Sphingobacteriaceae bacterium]
MDMIGRIFSLVKRNALGLSELYPVTAKHQEEVVIEASSSIIDGIKNYLESGKFDEILQFFQLCPPDCSFVRSTSHKFANRLGKFYNISMEEASKIASTLIPTALTDLVEELKASNDKDFTVVSLLSYINGRFVDFKDVAHRISA